MEFSEIQVVQMRSKVEAALQFASCYNSLAATPSHASMQVRRLRERLVTRCMHRTEANTGRPSIPILPEQRLVCTS